MTTKKTRGPAEAVAYAAVLKPKLEAAADRLNAKIAEFEEALKGLKLGVAAQVPIAVKDDGTAGVDLQFAKYGGEWHLVVKTWWEGEEDVYDLLQNKSREQRLIATEALPKLVDALIESAEKELARVSKSSDSIDALIASLKTGTKS